MVDHQLLIGLVRDVPVIAFLLAANGMVWRRLVHLENALIAHLEADHVEKDQ